MTQRTAEGAVSRTAVAAALGAVLLLALGLRHAGWDRWSFWLDEALQLFVVRHSLPEILGALRFERTHPPLDYLVTYLAMRLLPSVDALRWLPALWSTLTAAVLFVLSGGFARPFAAVGSALAFAVLPLAVHYGQEVRPYALAMLLVAVAAAARMLEGRNSRALAVRIAASVLATWTLVLSFVPLAFGWLGDLVAGWRERPGRAALVPIVTVAAFLPWVFAVHSQLLRPHELPATPPTARELGRYAVGLVADRQPSDRRLAAAVVAAFALAGALGAARAVRLALVGELVGVLAGAALFLLATRHWFELRYFTFALLPLSRLLGEGLDAAARLARSGRIPAFAAASALLVTAEAPALAENARSGRPDWRPAADYVTWQARHGRGGTVVPAELWTYHLLYAQHLRHSDLALTAARPTREEMASALSELHDGWIARMPASVLGKSPVDELLTVRPWAVFERSERVALYRFEKGKVIPP